ncbi:MAG: tetratricopeptide repeat protein [Candidatus Riflebacteria bacterium]|nr:tetratricopeptide repeat protein [Candidatus Riflebacteria bacterium]
MICRTMPPLLLLVLSWLMGLASSTLVAAAESGDQGPLTAFARANEAYRSRDYVKALTLYRSVDSKLRNPVVLYNRGNAAFKAGRLGEAILALEKAHRLAPRDPDIRVNLSYVKAQVRDSIPEEDLDLVTRLLSGIIGRFSLNELAAASSILFWVSMLLACALVLVRAPAPGYWLRCALAFFAVALVLVAGLFAIKFYLDEWHRNGVILAAEVQVMSGPGQDEIKRFTLHEGTQVRLVKEWDRWVQIGLPNGETGWTLSEHVGQI